MKRSALYEIIKNPHGGYSVKGIVKEGILRTFKSKEKAEEYLAELAVTAPHEPSIVLDIEDGTEVKDDSDHSGR